MILKEAPDLDLDRTIQRFEAWYQGQVLDRPPVTFLSVWKEGKADWPSKRHAGARERALDAEYQVGCFEASLANRAWVGDSFPCFSASVGADQVATLFGGELRFTERSSWAVHNVQGIRDLPARRPDFQTPCWSAIRSMVDLSLERGRRRWLTSLPNCVVGADVLVALRGPENLCLDLADDIEGVRLADARLTGFFPAIYEDVYGRIAAAGQPVSWEGDVTRGRRARVGCDFLCMISTAMAREAIYPGLESQFEHLDRCYFHLDSEGSLKHMDWLLAQPKVGAVQWVYGANRGPASKWVDVYRRIQAAGKGIELLPTSVGDALETMCCLKPDGVWIKFFGGVPEQDARMLVREVGKRENWAY